MRMRIRTGGRETAMGLVCLLSASVAQAACARARAELPRFEVQRTEVAPASFAGSARPVLDAARAYAPPGGDRAAPVSLTASDGTGLELVELDARASVLGPLAYTELHLTFENPEGRTLEGRFALTLPAGATVTRLSMGSDDDWHEAEVVPIVRGREAHEDALHRRVDPALAELAPDGRLLARVFPIPARGKKQLIVSYVHELRARGAPYRLPLAGLPLVKKLRVHVSTGAQIAHLEVDDQVPVTDFETPTLGAGLPDGLDAGRLAVVRVAPVVGGGPEPMAALTILFDTSASRVWRFRRDVDRLDALVKALDKRFGGDLPLRVIAFDQSVETIFDGRARGWDAHALDRLLVRRPLGASNLAGALAYVSATGRRTRLLVWSDMVATAGATAPGELAALIAGAHGIERVDVVVADEGKGGEAAARQLVSGLRDRDGVVLHAEVRAEEVAGRLGQRAVSGVRVEVAGARWVSPAQLDGVQDGDETLIYAELEPAAEDVPRRALAFELSGPLAAHFDVALTHTPAPLVDAAHAGARIAELERRGDGDAARRQILDLATHAHVLCRASAFVVLESDADYERLGISRRAPGELLVVGKSGLRVVPRRVAPQAVYKARLDARRQGPASIAGTVIERSTGAPLPDVTVVATSPSLIGSASELTDALGYYHIDSVPPGEYEVVFYYGELKVRQANIHVATGKPVEINARLDTAAASGGESINISQAAPTIDVSGTKQGVTIGQDYTKSLPAPGRSFEGSIGSEGGDPIEGVGGIDGSAAEPGAYARAEDAPAEADGGGDGGDDEPEHEAHLEPQDADDALAALVARHAARPDDPIVLRRLGEALTRRGKTTLAARVYGSLIDLYPGRADMLRVAGQWLEPLGAGSADLALDAYARALRDRPDHVTGYRMAAFALARRGRYAEAFALEARALRVPLPAGRFEGFAEVVRQDLGVLAAAWAAAEPTRRRDIRARAAALGASLDEAPSMRIVLTWETDASDVDLHIFDGDGNEASAQSPTLPDYGGTLVADVASGYGPEEFVIDSPDNFPYKLRVNIQDRGATGLVLGRVQILRHDGQGRLRFEDRPFAAAATQSVLDLGRLEP
jgi:tetratricopeptide (TPR) repeat protein